MECPRVSELNEQVASKLPMSDPHVVALDYRIEHGPDVIDWSRANPLDKQESGFRVQVGDGRVRFEFKAHYASEEAARFEIEADYIPNWEFVAGLARGPNAFTLRFDRSEIVDRNPTPGRISFAGRGTGAFATAPIARLQVQPSAYPEPPTAGIRRSPDVDSMYQRYLGYREGKEPLPGMAYFCLTVMQDMAGGRREAARHFAISDNVLQKIGNLCGKGGPIARKPDGLDHPYTPEDERFLKSAVTTLIRRAAEVEFGPDPSRRKIALVDI